MCGRYTLTKKPEEIQRLIEFEGDPTSLRPRYNLAPSQTAPVIVSGPRLKSMRWGLVPVWAKDEQIGNRMINARAETVPEKPAFKRLLARRRCLVPADGFYEWKKTGRPKQPFYFRLRNQAPFAFAGLWDCWHAPDGQELDTFTIITTEANAVLRPIHHRMPVMFTAEHCRAWLDAAPDQTDTLTGLLQPFPADQMTGFPVDPKVNSPQYEHPDCIHPLPDTPAGLELDLGV